jgi:hypothetical protein
LGSECESLRNCGGELAVEVIASDLLPELRDLFMDPRLRSEQDVPRDRGLVDRKGFQSARTKRE